MFFFNPKKECTVLYAKNAAFFYEERKQNESKRTQRTPRSFIKNAKERKNVAFF